MIMAIRIAITMTIIQITTITVIIKIPIGIRIVKTIIMTNEIINNYNNDNKENYNKILTIIVDMKITITKQKIAITITIH